MLLFFGLVMVLVMVVWCMVIGIFIIILWIGLVVCRVLRGWMVLLLMLVRIFM